MRKPNTLIRLTPLLLLFILIFEIMIWTRLPELFNPVGRIDLPRYLETTGTARMLLSLALLCFWVYQARKLYGQKTRWLALAGLMVGIVLILETGSRQIMLGIVIVGGGTFMLQRRKRLNHLYPYILIILVLVFTMLIVIVFLENGVVDFELPAPIIRALNPTPTEFDRTRGRFFIYDMYLRYIHQHSQELIFRGFSVPHDELFAAQAGAYGIWSPTAAHNSVLAIISRSGLISAFFYIIWHGVLFTSLWKAHILLGKPRESAVALSIAVAAFVIGLVSNYFTIVASPLVYLFYVTAGWYVNVLRDHKLFWLDQLSQIRSIREYAHAE